MATRTLTSKFEALRQKRRRNTNNSSSLSPLNTDIHDLNANDSQDALLKKEHSDDSMAIAVGLEHSLPPKWVEIVENIQKDVKGVRDNITILENLHAERLKVSFEKDEAEQERDINILTHEITRVMKKCENSLKRIASIGNDKGTNLPQQERVVRLNVMRNIGVELQNLSQSFRKTQKDYITRLRGQEETGSDFFKDDAESKQPLSLDEALERGLTQQQIQQLDVIERQASEREREIIHIAQSINDLATIFRELSVLVIEQGTILDRIDYNIEQARDKVAEGKKELVIADEYSKKARNIKCILLLLFIVIVLIVVLAVKKTKYDNK